DIVFAHFAVLPHKDVDEDGTLFAARLRGFGIQLWMRLCHVHVWRCTGRDGDPNTPDNERRHRAEQRDASTSIHEAPGHFRPLAECLAIIRAIGSPKQSPSRSLCRDQTEGLWPTVNSSRSPNSALLRRSSSWV